MEILLDHGAAIDQPGAAGNGQGAVNGCLANGRLEAAELLAARGASLDLEGASGVGRLDLVESFFTEDGSLKSNATTAQMKSGFNWACEYGRTSVVDFLLRGASMQARDTTERLACTGLRMADTGISSNCFWSEKRQSTSKTNVSVERPLGWALHGWQEGVRCGGPGHYHEVVGLLVTAGATVEAEWLANEKVRGDPKMLSALSGETRR